MMALNAAGALCGAVFVVAGSAGDAWNVYGVLLLLTLVGNLFMSLCTGVPLRAAYAYLVFSLAAMLAVPLLNVRAAWLAPHGRSVAATAIMLALFGLGLLQASAGTRAPKQVPQPAGGHRAGRWIAVVALSLFLALGVFLAYILLDLPFRAPFLAALIEVFVPEFAVFLGFAFLTAGALIGRLLPACARRCRRVALAVSLALFVVCMLPMLSVPSMVSNADRTMAATFGEAFRSDAAFASPLFRQTRFSIPEYFYGTPADGYTAQYDVVYYRGRQSVDEGLELKFDVYRPQRSPGQLPGRGSVLIRIHGGGWSTGDKGAANYGEINKYFARQGYVVFDIQYGLSTKTPLATPTSRSGDYTIDDMVRQIGVFTTYLADHAAEYGANPGSVFISGGSAGGHLTLAVGLGLANGNHPELLDPRITVKGLIPFYPANELAAATGIGGSTAWIDANQQIDDHAPPALIYQGSADSITPPEIARRVQQAYQAHVRPAIAIIYLPFGTHGSDLWFSSHYNQSFLYYMERFMYQHR